MLTWEQIFSIEPYNWYAVATCIFCGSIVGLERQLRSKPVGIRTSSLIVLGTYLFLASAALLTGDALDPSRVVGQVITGIGFIGAGVMISKNGSVVGVTSAASIWVLAAVGVMIALGEFMAAIKISILVVIILWGVDLLEDNTLSASKGVYSRIRRYSRLSKARVSRRNDLDHRDD